MTKLIALVALLAALAWTVTAAASWITARKARPALGRGKAPLAASAAEQNRALLLAQLRTVVAAVFTVAIFAAVFRFSVGISGQLGLTAVLTTKLSISAGLLLFSALPAKKVATRELGKSAAGRTLVAMRTFLLPVATLVVFAAFVTVTGTAAPEYLPWHDGLPAFLAALALSASALLAGHRISTTKWLPDPRMDALDRAWRALSLRHLTTFASGTLLAGCGGTALLARLGMKGVLAAQAPAWATLSAAAGAALLAAGVVLMFIAVKGTLQLRASVRQGTPPQRVSA